MDLPELPIEMIVEIFEHALSHYPLFRALNWECNKIQTLWDGWDFLIEQGWTVDIGRTCIIWKMRDKHHNFGELPAISELDGVKVWCTDDNIEFAYWPWQEPSVLEEILEKVRLKKLEK